MLGIQATLAEEEHGLGFDLKCFFLKDFTDVEFSVTDSANISPFRSTWKFPTFEPAFLTETKCTKLTVPYFLMIFIVFLATIAGALLIFLCFHVGLTNSEYWIIVHVIIKLVLGLGDLNDEGLSLFPQLLDQVVHDVDVHKATELVVGVVLFRGLDEVIVGSRKRIGGEEGGSVLWLLIQGLTRSSEHAATQMVDN